MSPNSSRLKDTSVQDYMYSSCHFLFVVLGHAHLTDFNIATIIKDGERATALAGTKPYMGIVVFNLITVSWFLLENQHLCLCRKWFKRWFCFHECFLSSALSSRDLPIFCQWWDWLCLWSGLVVPGGDGLWGASWMGEAWCDAKDVVPFILLHSQISLMPSSDASLPQQRPYDIHASNSVESLIQLFSTISVQYSPAWPKDLVSLLRKVRQTFLFRITLVGEAAVVCQRSEIGSTLIQNNTTESMMVRYTSFSPSAHRASFNSSVHH